MSAQKSKPLTKEEKTELVTGSASVFKDYVRTLHKRSNRIVEALVKERNDVRDKSQYPATTPADYLELVGNTNKPVLEVSNYLYNSIEAVGAIGLSSKKPKAMRTTHYMDLSEFGNTVVKRMAYFIEDHINNLYGGEQWKNQEGGVSIAEFLRYMNEDHEKLTVAYINKLIDTFITLFGVIKPNVPEGRQKAVTSIFTGQYDSKGNPIYSGTLVYRAIPLFLLTENPEDTFGFDPVSTLVQRSTMKAVIRRSLGATEKRTVPEGSDDYYDRTEGLESDSGGVFKTVKNINSLEAVIKTISEYPEGSIIVNYYNESDVGQGETYSLPKGMTLA